MSSDANREDDTPLTNTLRLALTQCEAQVRDIAKQSEVIEILRSENERLKQELGQLRARHSENAEVRFNVQFQDAFKQVAEKQVEIERLKEKLRAVKSKAQKRGFHEPISSSPGVQLSDTEHRSQSKTAQEPGTTLARERTVEVSAPADNKSAITDLTPCRKRPRSHSPRRHPLQKRLCKTDSPAVLSAEKEERKNKKQPRIERRIAAIPVLAEDGDDYDQKRPRTGNGRANKALPASVYNRLGDLLDGRVPENVNLLKSRSTSPIVRTKPEATPTRSSSADLDLPTPHSEARSNKATGGFLVSRRPASPGPEDEEPYRSRPLNRLGLMHFKLNPATNLGLDYAYNQTVRGAERRCLPGCTRECCIGTFRVLAESLPNPVGPSGQPISDNDMLLQYLGQGSEDRVRNLTPKARENLLHDARTKMIADTYGKMHRDMHERARSPPGFWRTDMPESQEERQDRERAKIAEREEVLRRRNEALKEGGRWKFADE